MPLILITGANGQLGMELKKISVNYPEYRFIFTDFETLNITDAEITKKFITEIKPDWIVNCAAYNLVDKAEEKPDEAFKVNSEGVMNIVNAIKNSPCRFIHFSTDYVFDGKSNRPYIETDIPNPLSKYGASKLEGERNALKNRHSMVIRTSWLYSAFGNNFVKTIIKKAKENASLKVVNDQTGTPTWAADLANAVIKIIHDITRNNTTFTGGIYHYSNEGECTWFNFAKTILNFVEINCNVEPVSSDNYPTIALRPHYSVLSKKKIIDTYKIRIPKWDISLKKCIDQMKKENII
ncbi:MAG TPA: dTDP-4-dehydrorhamnose reductase [Bacteroidales bacterium]|nr:dTDP-4-dehydrorhamnose reductase [Bacteroidales bacterium]HOU95274.1 dTDP-4-dehydrorhamnose reductase [Bacteroidales bacterium]HQG35610.1 dTDP-4-dehydrorhamnose reductase [Bacteroidales bacterium]HQG51920.1 dTDP-4-dehydrorhamnose reductase [Bacteroidales bacterium]HQJ19615.1 dTDP-4-dehydrorhamnose reductase [Bacteroidales bacterium]